MPDAEPVPSDSSTHLMQCTEVWGGNASVQSAVVMTGLDAWVYSRPFEGDAEGGDIHYLSSCSTGRITRLLVADVSGHGSVVATTAQRLRTLMRRYMNYVNQSRLVEGLNREFGGLAESGHFATAIVATFWCPTRELEITNAGHPAPLLYRAETRQWQQLPGATTDPAPTSDGPSDIPLGIIDITTYARARARLDQGDLLLFYTDALIEAKDQAGRMLGVEGLCRVLQSLPPTQPENLISSLLHSIGAGPAGQHLDDDTTMLLLRLNERHANASFFDGVRATGRVLAEFARCLLPGGGPIPWPELRLDNLGGVWSNRFNRR